MHAKSGLRVVLKWKIFRPDSVIAAVLAFWRLMQKQIRKRIEQLGGSVSDPTDDSLLAMIQSISFPHPIYDFDWDFYGVKSFLDENISLYETNQPEFIDRLVRHYYSDHDHNYGQSNWLGKPFTPMKLGTKGHKKWGKFFAKSPKCDLDFIRSFADGHEFSFVQIMRHDGVCEYTYVCLQDRRPENPTIFGTGDDYFFETLYPLGAFSSYLKTFYTRRRFRNTVQDGMHLVASGATEW